jgi:pyruvate dehydrogenase E2 component (dihydrolipoamide acetyltransferase)
VATAIAMPRLGMTMEEGRVVEWPLALGDRVEKGQVVVIIESEKAEAEIDATAAGYFRHIYVEVDEVVPCATLLGAITDTPDEPFDAEAFAREHGGPPEAPKAAAPVSSRAAASAPAPGPGTARGDRRKPVAPAARALARKLGLDAEHVPGTGPGGRVTKADVEAFAAARAALVEVAPGVALEVPTQGEGGDPVLLLPGFGTDVSVFARQVPALAATHRVLGVNPRGVGLSDAPEQERYEVPQAAADAAAVSEAPAHVIGASLGAAVAIELALAHPERVRTLTLVTPFVEASPRLLTVVDGWCGLAREVPPATLAHMLLPWFFSSAFLADAAARERTLRGLAETSARVPATTLARSAAGLRAWSGSRGEMLAEIAAPTLVIAGGGDLLTGDAEAIAAAIPRAGCVVVPGAGHAVALEAPEPVNRAILAHLAGRRDV